MLLFLVIVACAALFRLTNLHLVEFKTDEAINILLAARPLFGQPLPPGATLSSIGIMNPPLFTYLLSPITLISLDPRTISFFIGLANTLAIGGLFLTVKKYYGRRVSLITSLLLSFSPWAILYSRKIWMQDLLVPFFVPFFLSLHKLVVERKQKYWVVYVASVLLFIQLHQASIVFLLLVSLFLVRKVKINASYIVIGFLLGFLPLVPYLLYEVQNACPDCQTFFAAKNQLRASPTPLIFLRPLQIVGQGNFHFVLGDDMLSFAKKFPLVFALRKLFYAEYLLLPFDMFVFMKKAKKLRFLATTALLLPCAYFLLRVEPLMHYFIIVSPLLSLFVAFGFFFLLTHRNRLISLSATALLLGVLFASIAFNIAFFSLLEKQKSVLGDYGTTLAESMRTTREKFKNYEHRKDYQEVVLASYIPIWLMFGYLPPARMLYPREQLVTKLAFLEKEVKEMPDNPKALHQLVAYHTLSPPTRETVAFLRKKYKEMSEYKVIYREVYADYLKRNYKKEFVSTDLGFSLELPQHWTVREEIDGLIIEADGYTLAIKKAQHDEGGSLLIGTIPYKLLVIKGTVTTRDDVDQLVRSIRTD